MTRTLIGLDSTGVGCIKITKGNYDPRTTPDSLRERFFFSSKWKDQVQAPAIELCTLVPGTGTGSDRVPSGSGASTFARQRIWGGTNNARLTYYWFAKSRFPDLRYNVPMIDLKHRGDNGRFTQEKQVRVTRGYSNNFGVYGGYVGYEKQRGEWRTAYVSDEGVAARDIDQASCSGRITVQANEGEIFAVVWNLPGNNVALDGPSSPPSPAGKMAVQITSAECRVAKPGYDCRTATPAQLAFDANGRPLSVIAAADIAVPAGASSYDTGIPLPDGVVAEMCFYAGSTLYYPSIPRDSDELGAEYWFDGTLLRFNNTNAACRARFIVFAADPLGPSSGSNRVLRQFAADGENVVQLLRPGAAATPRFADIIVDSRRPVIQIVDDGYLSVAAGEGLQQSISYDASGFFPVVKFVTVHGAGSDDLESWATASRAPQVKRLLPQIVSGGATQAAGDSAHCTYNATGATFTTNRGRPVDRYYDVNENLINVVDTNPIVGIRWYVLGIPT